MAGSLVGCREPHLFHANVPCVSRRLCAWGPSAMRRSIRKHTTCRFGDPGILRLAVMSNACGACLGCARNDWQGTAQVTIMVRAWHALCSHVLRSRARNTAPHYSAMAMPPWRGQCIQQPMQAIAARGCKCFVGSGSGRGQQSHNWNLPSVQRVSVRRAINWGGGPAGA